MIFGANVKGRILIDEGAKDAITNGASLLLQGIKEFSGTFNKGDVVRVVCTITSQETGELEDEMIARARINYSIHELQHFENIPVKDRKEYFKINNIREIISHENMVFLKY